MFNHIQSQAWLKNIHIPLFDCLRLSNIFYLMFEQNCPFGICYLVAVDDVGEKKGEKENEDDGDKDEANC